VTLADEVAVPEAFVAVAVKVAVSDAATLGAVQLTRAPVVPLKVPGVPAVWAHVIVGAGDPVATADTVTIWPAVTGLGLALAVTVGATPAQLDVGGATRPRGHGLSPDESVPAVDMTPPLTRNAMVSKLSGGTGLPTTCSGKM
jgi:hypothetical protein